MLAKIILNFKCDCPDKAFRTSYFVKDSLYNPSKKVLARYKKDNKYGLINAIGKLLLKAEYKKIDLGYAHHSLLVAKQDPQSKKTVAGYYNVSEEDFITAVTYVDTKPFENKQFCAAQVKLQNNSD